MPEFESDINITWAIILKIKKFYKKMQLKFSKSDVIWKLAYAESNECL